MMLKNGAARFNVVRLFLGSAVSTSVAPGRGGRQGRRAEEPVCLSQYTDCGANKLLRGSFGNKNNTTKHEIFPPQLPAHSSDCPMMKKKVMEMCLAASMGTDSQGAGLSSAVLHSVRKEGFCVTVSCLSKVPSSPHVTCFCHFSLQMSSLVLLMNLKKKKNTDHHQHQQA